MTALSFDLTRKIVSYEIGCVVVVVVDVVVVMVSQNIDCHRNFSVSHFLSFKSLNPQKLTEKISSFKATFNFCSNSLSGINSYVLEW